MSLQGTSRRVVRDLAHRSIDWSHDVLKSHPKVAPIANNFRAWVASTDAMAEKYAAPPTPIDFASSKASIRDKDLVDSIEKFYNSNTPPPEVHVWSDEKRELFKKTIEESKEYCALLKEVAEDTELEIEFREANRTTRETTVYDWKMMYPDMAEEVETELENREWFKDLSK